MPKTIPSCANFRSPFLNKSPVSVTAQIHFTTPLSLPPNDGRKFHINCLKCGNHQGYSRIQGMKTCHGWSPGVSGFVSVDFRCSCCGAQARWSRIRAIEYLDCFAETRLVEALLHVLVICSAGETLERNTNIDEAMSSV
jgi:hypothetical protein